MTRRLATSQTDRALDSARIRRDFPILSRTVHDGVPLAYLDNAATTQKPTSVLSALRDYYEAYNSNVHRALHALGEKATLEYEQTRVAVADWLRVPSPRSVVLTRGTTESINLVAHGWGRKHVRAGDVILLTEMEHHSNVVPWQLLVQQTGATLDYVPIREDGALDLDAFERKLTPDVKLLAVTHMSNVLGTINPIRQMAESAHRVGARVLVDGAQSVPHFRVDVQDLDCDFLAFSGHKAVGPTGIGVLVAKEECLEAMDPFMGGGEMINKVGRDSSTWAEIPHKFEAGTPNIAGAIGLTAAIQYLSGIGLDAVQRREEVLTAYALRRLGDVDGLRLLGSAPERGGVLSFVLDGAHPHDIAQFVDQDGIAIRAGHMCAQPLMRALGHHAVSRASLYLYTVEEEIDRLAEALVRARDFFAHGI